MCDAEAFYSLHSPAWTQLKLLLHLNNNGALRQFIHLPLFVLGKIAWWLLPHLPVYTLGVVLCWVRVRVNRGRSSPVLFQLLTPGYEIIPATVDPVLLYMNADGLPLVWNIWTKRPLIWLTFAPFVFPRLIWVSAAAAAPQTLRRRLAGHESEALWGQSLSARLNNRPVTKQEWSEPTCYHR